MKIKLTYTIEKCHVFYTKEDGKVKKEITDFAHEDIDMDEICELLALKYRNENFGADEYVKVSCSVD